MLIATYQPLLGHTDETRRLTEHDCFREKLDGDAPLFCFPARTADEFRFRSLLAAPRMPERLLLFDTDDFVMFDAIEWDRVYDMPRDSAEFAERFAKMAEDADIRFCECAISEKHIGEAIAEINIREWLTSDEDYCEDEESNALVRQMKTKAKEAAARGIAQAANQKAMPGAEAADPKAMTAMVLQNAFINFLGSAAWCQMTGVRASIIDLIPFFPDYKDKEGMDAWNRFQELRSGTDGEELSHAGYMEMCHALEEAVASGRRRFLSDVERNAPCPCGSGKKFKKCHGARPVTLFPDFPPQSQEEATDA